MDLKLFTTNHTGSNYFNKVLSYLSSSGTELRCDR